MRLSKVFSFIGLSLILLATASCATILQSGPDRIFVNSEPAGAKVSLDGMPVGVTPVQVSVNRKDEGVFLIQKDGFSSVQLDRDKVVAGWTFANLLFWPGIIVDLATSNQGKYTESPIFVTLNPIEAPAAAAPAPKRK